MRGASSDKFMIGSTLKIFWVGAVLAFAIAAAGDPCQDVCDNGFSDKDLNAACLKGCDNFKAGQRSPFSILELVIEGDKTIEVCGQSCNGAYEDAKLLSACKQGCQYGQDHGSDPAKSLFDMSNDFFKSLEANDSHRHGGVTLNFGLPEMDGIWMNNEHPFGKMMTQMNEQMNQMMESMKKGMMPSLLQSSGGGGKMYIMKSGPGYHEEKTYDIDADGRIRMSMPLIKNDVQWNDMMEKNNPLDSVDNNDVEIFDTNNGDFARLINEESQEDEKLIELIGRPFAEQKEPSFGLRNVEGPKLPETGLRSRDICHNEDKKWSTWVNCLHLKLGMPRWFMTTSICLGIIFLLWLCFVIPSNAPKQRVKKNCKEAEAAIASPVVITKVDPKDLPPSYDDVANKDQLEPVHEKKPVA